MKALALKWSVVEGSNTYTPCSPEEATHLRMRIPGPLMSIHIPVQTKGTREGTGNWSWNGSVDSPTVKPSILNDFRPHDTLVNHIWINDGMVQFLDDCSHELKGQTLPLLDIDTP